MTKDPEKLKKQAERYKYWVSNNREHVNRMHREWASKNNEYKKEYHRKWYGKDIEKSRASKRATHLRRRNEIIDLLGGKCKKCGFDDKRALQVDHVFSDGATERREKQMSVSRMKRQILISMENMDGRYQLLCANCNWIKRYENKELFGKCKRMLVL